MLRACPLLGGVQGCIAPPKFPNLQKTPPNCCLWAKSVWKIGNFMYFWTKKWLKIQGRVLFCQICTLWGKKKNSRIFAKCPHSENQEEIHFWKMCTPPQTKILGMGLVETSQMQRLRMQGGLRGAEPPQYFEWGVGVSFSPPKKILYP